MRGASWVLLLATVATLGCSGSGDEIVKSEITGTITYNNEPVEFGEIHFLPADGTVGPQANGGIRDGKYAVQANGGVPVGNQKVAIFAYFDLPKPDFLPPLAPTPREQYIPAKYNKQTELTVTIEADRDEPLDFKLEGPPRKLPPKS
jgi:hypothetical protein